MQDESQLQIQCVRWFRYQYPKLAPLLIHIPNGRHRSKREAFLLKQEGVTAGVADLALFVPKSHPALFIEMKTPTGRQTDTQKEWQRHVTDAGYKYVVVRSVDEFVDTINFYLTKND